jgi:glycine/D-amino acid oxidase-like deaminating enzyme
MKIVVVGAGVSGLTCAVTLLEAGAEVVVWTAGAPSGTVSAVAGAMLGPVFGFGDERSLAWERRSDRVFRRLAGDPATGVRLVTGRLLAAPELGLRPGRPRVRLEAEQVAGTTVIHDYGHDGSGVFWSWGCAAEVAGLCGLDQAQPTRGRWT